MRFQAWISSGQHIKMFSWQKYATYLLDSLSFYLHTMAGKLGHDHIFIVVDYTLAGFISTISRFADSECQSGTCCEIAFEPLDLQPFNSLLMDVNKGPQVIHVENSICACRAILELLSLWNSGTTRVAYNTHQMDIVMSARGSYCIF